MAASSAIGEVTKSLQTLLEAEITQSADFTGIPIDLRSPKDIRIAKKPLPLVSMWLYRVTRLDELTNAPPRRSPPNHVEMPPLPLNLHYLLTPLATDMITAQRLLGRVMQAFFDNAILSDVYLTPALVSSGLSSVSIHFEPHTLEELTRIWEALHEPYDLSSSYDVQYVPISSKRRQPEEPPVQVRTARYAEIVEAR
ncbi:MAG: DUF4255 domain-containing protein [Azospirillum sp.]|nr:DUF4255 domain-containing protein [Azospirillum sp.]